MANRKARAGQSYESYPDLPFESVMAELFYALLEKQQLDPSRCLMIGNDRETDIAGAQTLGIDTLYMHTALTPPDQAKADPTLHPLTCPGPHWEYEGENW